MYFSCLCTKKWSTIKYRGDLVGHEREESGPALLAHLYACFLRVAELPGQWHEGGPSFLTVCMIFPRGPLALLSPTVPF